MASRETFYTPLAAPTGAARTATASAAACAAVRAPPGLRVLHVFRYFRPDFTGEGLYLEKLAPELAALGVQSDVAATASAAIPPRLGGIGTVRLFGDDRHRSRRGLSRRFAWFLLRHARGYDVVHFHSLIDRLFLAHVIARAVGCRIVQSCTLDDGLGAVLGTYRAPWRWAAARLVRLIHDVVAISPALRDDNLAVLPAARVHLVPQGVQIPAPAQGSRAALRAAFDLAEDDLVLLYVGGLHPRKDVAFLIENLPPRTSAGQRVRLLLVGPVLDRQYADALEAMAAQHPPGTVVMTGYMDDPTPAYRLADAFVFASRQEGFGNVLLEAMAAGLPVLARLLPGVTDSFIADGLTGMLFDTAPQYRTRLRTLLDQPTSRQRLGAAAAAAVRRDHDMTAIAARYRDIYRGHA